MEKSDRWRSIFFCELSISSEEDRNNFLSLSHKEKMYLYRGVKFLYCFVGYFRMKVLLIETRLTIYHEKYSLVVTYESKCFTNKRLNRKSTFKLNLQFYNTDR